MAAWPSDQETPVAGGNWLAPWAAAAAAAAWKKPGDITRQISAAVLAATLTSSSERSQVSRSPLLGSYLCERRSCCSHWHDLLLVVLWWL